MSFNCKRKTNNNTCSGLGHSWFNSKQNWLSQSGSQAPQQMDLDKCSISYYANSATYQLNNTHTDASESDLSSACSIYLQRKCCRLVSDVSPDNVTLDRQHATLHSSDNTEVDFKRRARTSTTSVSFGWLQQRKTRSRLQTAKLRVRVLLLLFLLLSKGRTAGVVRRHRAGVMMRTACLPITEVCASREESTAND